MNAAAGLSSNAQDRIVCERDQFVASLGGGSNLLVRTGLVADRKGRSVDLWAAATGLGPLEPLEFVLIGEASGHGYEALAISGAKPSDVYEGLQYIGMKPGRPVNRSGLAFWPKGERVLVSIASVDPDAIPIPAETFVLDDETGAAMRQAGFVFTGASPDAQGHTVYVPDEIDPCSILSTYNEPGSVLDVPRLAEQGSVYGRYRLHPDHALPSNSLLRITITPERTSGLPRVLDLDVTIASNIDSPDTPQFIVTNDGSGPGNAPLDGDVFAAAVLKWVSQRRDPFVRLAFEPSLTFGRRADCGGDPRSARKRRRGSHRAASAGGVVRPGVSTRRTKPRTRGSHRPALGIAAASHQQRAVGNTDKNR